MAIPIDPARPRRVLLVDEDGVPISLGGEGGPHPDLATHDALGLATDAELATHAAGPHGGEHPDLATHDALGLATDAEAATHAALSAASTHGNLGHANTNDPVAGEKAALVGTSGTPGSGNKYVTDADARNTDARTAVAHALVGALHTLVGGTAGFVVRAVDATSFAWARLNHSDLANVGATDHHSNANDHANVILAHADTAHTDPPVLEADANWVDLTDGGATTLHSHAGGPGGGFSATQAVVDLPYPASRVHVVNVIDAEMSATDKVMAVLAGVDETQTNSSDSIDVLELLALPKAGSFDLQIWFVTPAGGPIVINYARSA